MALKSILRGYRESDSGFNLGRDNTTGHCTRASCTGLTSHYQCAGSAATDWSKPSPNSAYASPLLDGADGFSGRDQFVSGLPHRSSRPCTPPGSSRSAFYTVRPGLLHRPDRPGRPSTPPGSSRSALALYTVRPGLLHRSSRPWPHGELPERSNAGVQIATVQ